MVPLAGQSNHRAPDIAMVVPREPHGRYPSPHRVRSPADRTGPAWMVTFETLAWSPLTTPLACAGVQANGPLLVILREALIYRPSPVGSPSPKLLVLRADVLEHVGVRRKQQRGFEAERPRVVGESRIVE